jgi:hypothetical protein
MSISKVQDADFPIAIEMLPSQDRKKVVVLLTAPEPIAGYQIVDVVKGFADALMRALDEQHKRSKLITPEKKIITP